MFWLLPLSRYCETNKILVQSYSVVWKFKRMKINNNLTAEPLILFSMSFITITIFGLIDGLNLSSHHKHKYIIGI